MSRFAITLSNVLIMACLTGGALIAQQQNRPMAGAPPQGPIFAGNAPGAGTQPAFLPYPGISPDSMRLFIENRSGRRRAPGDPRHQYPPVPGWTAGMPPDSLNVPAGAPGFNRAAATTGAAGIEKTATVTATSTLSEWSHSSTINTEVGTGKISAEQQLTRESDGGYLVTWTENRDVLDSLKSPDELFDGTAAEGYGHALSGAGDLNGDGYQDFVMGVPLNDIGGADAGAVYIFYGGPGFDNTPDMILVGSAAGDQFGYSVTAGRDFNGDGIADIAVGAPYNDAGGVDAGRVYVYFGGASMDTSADMVMTGEAAGDNFGYAVTGLDSYVYDYWNCFGGTNSMEIIVGAPLSDAAGSNSGRVYVYSSGGSADNIPDVILNGENPGDNFGRTVAAMGLNTDNYRDIVVGAPLNSWNGAEAGRAYIYLGGSPPDSIKDYVFTGLHAGDHFGASLLTAPGYYDAHLWIGAPLNDSTGTDAGAVYLYDGGYHGLDTISDGSFYGENADDRFGTSIAYDYTFGVVIGAPFNDDGGTDAGKVYWYSAPDLYDNTADFTITGESAGDRLGSSMAVSLDIDGDYQNDLLISAPGFDAVSSDEGRVYVYSANSTEVKIVGQKLDRHGTPQWTEGGKNLTTAFATVWGLHTYGDGQGGAYLVWSGYRYRETNTYDNVYVARMDASGSLLWTATPAHSADEEYTSTTDKNHICFVGSTGDLYLSWISNDYTSYPYHYAAKAQRIGTDGTLKWGTDGVTLFSDGAIGTSPPLITPDDAGGVFVLFTKYDYTPGYYPRILMRLDSAGISLWSPGGIDVGSTNSYAYNDFIPQSFGNGDVLVGWVSLTYDLHANIVSSAGVVGPDLTICDAPGDSYSPMLLKTSDGAIIAAWYDTRDYATNYTDLYAQKLTSTGLPLWAANGVPVENSPQPSSAFFMIGDGTGGALLTFSTISVTPPFPSKVWAKKLKPDGTDAWSLGTATLHSTLDYVNPIAVEPDGEGGLVSSWTDQDPAYTFTFIVQNVDHNGYLGLNDPDLTSAGDVPADQGGKVSLAWDRSYLDQYPSSLITYYSVWRGIDPAAIPSQAAILKPGDVPSEFNGPAIRMRNAPNGTSTAWEWIANLPGHYLENYSYTAPTLADSTAAGTPSYGFFVSAQTADPFLFWDSNVMDSYSVDNLSPAPPAALSADAVGGTAIRLDWSSTGDRDLGGYLVYRSTAEGFTPDEESLIGQTQDTTLDDSAPALGKNYYRVVGFDVHGNHGSSSPEASSALAYGITSTAGSNGTILPSGSVVIPAGGNQQFVITPATGYHVDSLLVDGAPVDSTQSYTFTNISGMHTIEARFAQTPALVTVAARSGWNLVSVPLTVGDYSGSALLPTAVTSPYAFSGGSYVVRSTLANGPGYWVKFSGDQNLGMSGFDRIEEDITVEEGWNLVGSISTPVSVSSIGSEPPGIVTSQFFSYEGSYVVSPVIEPGKGYWVKAGQAGTITLSSSSGIPAASTIRIVPNGEMPPPPPGVAGTDGAVPQDYALEQNYPNPFNPVTTVRYALPEGGKVRLAVYSTLGEEVATLVDGYQEAGYREVSFDAASLPSGVYTYRLSVNTKSFAKKMIVLK
jgi:hypothetical protein